MILLSVSKWKINSSLCSKFFLSPQINTIKYHFQKMHLSTQILDGKLIAKQIEQEISERVLQLKKESGTIPQIGVILVGENPSSHTYVKLKKLAAERVGMRLQVHQLPSSTSEEQVTSTLNKLNSDQDTHGIIVQLPLPKRIQEPYYSLLIQQDIRKSLIERIHRSKDIDGLTSCNMGILATGHEVSKEQPFFSFSPCTPLGIMELLKRSGISLEGKHVVVLGRSIIVGLPVGIMSLHRNATVTYNSSKNISLTTLATVIHRHHRVQ